MTKTLGAFAWILTTSILVAGCGGGGPRPDPAKPSPENNPQTTGPKSDKNPAEELFRQMEQKVQKCKTFQTEVEVVLTGDRKGSLKGSVAIAPGDKIRTELDGTWSDSPAKILMLSDGSKMKTRGYGPPGLPDRDVRKNVGLEVLVSLTRAGVFQGFLDIVEMDPDQKLPPYQINNAAASDFKVGKKETVGGVEAQAIEYVLAWQYRKNAAVTIWIDVKTNLPVKHVVVLPNGPKPDAFIVTETYTKTVVDGKIDEKQFEVPK
jgi:outer membrane lipoprotein-sorting protein